MTYVDPWFGIVILLLSGAVTVYRKYIDWKTPDKGTTEWAHHLYVNDKIDEAELERRIDVLEDPEADRIRKSVERISGIGEQTSWDIAARFDTLDDVRTASLDELTSVPNVGEKRASALRESL